MLKLKSSSRLIESCNGLWSVVNIYVKIPGGEGQFKDVTALFTPEISRFPSDASDGAFRGFVEGSIC